MEVVPAIDISDGKCVRLFKGKKGTETVYYENPLDALNFWINKGAKRLHFVDLDGAWGSDKNKIVLKNMIKKASDKLKVQIGGGIRSYDQAIDLINIGADRIIIGTLAVKNPEIVKKLAKISKLGAGYILFSAVEADGAFTGPDIKNIKKMVNSVNIPVYAAGGVRNEKDFKDLEDIGVYGVIVGKAFYENKIPFSIITNSKYNA
ncbi:MAG: HisA/HisF-related TIM barrel protein [Promethearchaeota archaeon]